jgi:hypothetical protein
MRPEKEAASCREPFMAAVARDDERSAVTSDGSAVRQAACQRQASGICKLPREERNLASWVPFGLIFMDHSSAAVDPSAGLGIPGYTFADLHEPERLASLYDRFCEEVQDADPALWRKWDAYRHAPDQERSPIEVSNLIVAMAPHVSRFSGRSPSCRKRWSAPTRAGDRARS